MAIDSLDRGDPILLCDEDEYGDGGKEASRGGTLDES